MRVSLLSGPISDLTTSVSPLAPFLFLSRRSHAKAGQLLGSPDFRLQTLDFKLQTLESGHEFAGRINLRSAPSHSPMPCIMRVEYPGAIDHVMDRGDRREDWIFQGCQVGATSVGAWPKQNHRCSSQSTCLARIQNLRFEPFLDLRVRPRSTHAIGQPALSYLSRYVGSLGRRGQTPRQPPQHHAWSCRSD